MGLGWQREFDRLLIVLGHWTVTAELRYQIFHILKNWINSLRWRHNGRDSVSSHQLHDCLLNRLLRRRSKKIPKLRVSGLCVGKSPWTGEFPTQIANNAANVSIWWRHHVPNSRNPKNVYFLWILPAYWNKNVISFCPGMYVGSSVFTTCKNDNAI